SARGLTIGCYPRPHLSSEGPPRVTENRGSLKAGLRGVSNGRTANPHSAADSLPLTPAAASHSCLKWLRSRHTASGDVDRRKRAPYPPFRRFRMDLFEEVIKLRRAGKRGALATIVHTNGSLSSHESSRMLVREDGSIAGTIGGGCVEAEVWAAAKEVMSAEAPRKMTFSLNNEANYDN